MGTAGPGLETIVCGEGQEAGVVNGLIAVITGDHHFHVVVETGGCCSLKVLESAHVFTYGDGEILRFDKAQVLAARVTQDITEGMHPPPPFGGENDLVSRKIHLRLCSRTGFEPLHRRLRRAGANGAQVFFHDAVTAFEPQPLKLLMQADCSQVWVTVEQLRDAVGIWVQYAGAARTRFFSVPIPELLLLLQHAVDAFAVDSQLTRDGSLRCAGVAQTNYLIAGRFIHAAVFISPTRS